MSNTMRTLIFIASLFFFLLFFITVNYLLPTQFISGLPNPAVFTAALYILAYIGVLYSQALVKYLYTKSAMKGVNIIKSFPVKTGGMREKLILLVLPIIAVILPMVSTKKVTPEKLTAFVYIAVLAVILEILSRLNAKTLRLYATNKGFGINGIDFRLELSIPFSYTNAAGWYPFERIENYLAYGNKVFLYQTYDMGVIGFECDTEEVHQIKGLLIANGVPERRY